MPTRADLDAARPRCDAPAPDYGPPHLMTLDQLAEAEGRRCLRPLQLRPFISEPTWCCELHGARYTAAELVASQQPCQ